MTKQVSLRFVPRSGGMWDRGWIKISPASLGIMKEMAKWFNDYAIYGDAYIAEVSGVCKFKTFDPLRQAISDKISQGKNVTLEIRVR